MNGKEGIRNSDNNNVKEDFGDIVEDYDEDLNYEMEKNKDSLDNEYNNKL